VDYPLQSHSARHFLPAAQLTFQRARTEENKRQRAEHRRQGRLRSGMSGR